MQCLAKGRSLPQSRPADKPISIYYENRLDMWPHLHFHDDQADEWWFKKCKTPCKWTQNRDEADVLVYFWFNDVGGRPVDLKPHQRTASIFLEPYVGLIVI
jgi:hypothetical protein